MSTAKVTQNKNGDVLNIIVSGYIGENAGLFDLNSNGVKTVTIDLSGVNYINSVGVKNWINWTGRFGKDLAVQFVNCPPLIINQVNMVAGFLPPSGTVESLFGPYVCNDCNREATKLLTRGKEFQYATAEKAAGVSPPAVNCPKCNKPMEFDAVPAKFFNFLKTPKP